MLGGSVPPCGLVKPRARRASPAGPAGRPPRLAPGGSVRPCRLLEPRARRFRPAGHAVRPPWSRARRLRPACTADPAPLPSARRPIHAGRLVYTRVPRPFPASPHVDSFRALWSTPAYPNPEAESRCEGCWRRAALARRLSPTGQAGGAPCSEAQYVCAAWWSPTPGGRVPPGRLVDHRGLSQEAQFCRGGWWSPMFGSSVPPGRLVEPRSPAPAG